MTLNRESAFDAMSERKTNMADDTTPKTDEQELDVETIEITPAVDLSDFSDAQDLPETGASVGYNSCSHALL
jgi:hypothetical protein